MAGTKAVSLGRTTPSAEWNLEELLGHLDDSLDALFEGLTGRRIGQLPYADRVCGFRTRACAVFGAWVAGPSEDALAGERPLDGRVVAAVGAVEITVRGGTWPGPADGSGPFRRASRPNCGRGVRYAAAVVLPSRARTETRLLAFLGRRLQGLVELPRALYSR
ncbi:MAG: TIGR03086 family protein [Streptomyces sp.]